MELLVAAFFFGASPLPFFLIDRCCLGCAFLFFCCPPVVQAAKGLRGNKAKRARKATSDDEGGDYADDGGERDTHMHATAESEADEVRQKIRFNRFNIRKSGMHG